MNNKAEVLVVRASGYREDPLAISIEFLRKNALYKEKIADTSIIVLTEKSGTTRAYQSGDIDFVSYNHGKLKDKYGELWTITEDNLQSSDRLILKRIPSHNIFWFAWYNTYPNTRLLK